MRTGFVWDERTMWHDSGNHFGPPSHWIEPSPHPESEASKRRIKNLLDASGLTRALVPIEARHATLDELLLAHSAEYIARIQATAASGGGNIAKVATTHLGANGYDIAALAAGGAISAVDAVLSGDVDNAYVLMRPPGHHAEVSEGKGFCIFNNGALAARYAIQARGLSRIALVDWDAHHGNGAQQIFWDDPTVLAISIHQDRAFPQSIGDVTENGGGAGLGYTINIPLPPGSGEGAYVAAFERVILPALREFRPDLIIVPCGLDPGYQDPTARMLLSSESFRKLTACMMVAACAMCGNRLVFLHEGGYALHSVPFLALAIIEELSQHRTGVEDPFLAAIGSSPYACLQAPQDAVIKAAEQIIRTNPPMGK
jgi:acetoin utilization deacetylase AcuC-like enzyme